MAEGTTAARIAATAGMASAALTIVFGLLHPKGSSDVGTVEEWMTRVGGSDSWIIVHLALLVASMLFVLASAGIARSYLEERAAAWARAAFAANVVATSVAVVTFLFDGAVVKHVAELWESHRSDAATLGAARLATEAGFVLVAGLQLITGFVALLFACAGLSSATHPRWLAWLALVAGLAGVVPGAAHYVWGAATWSVNVVYLSSAGLALWTFAMSRRLWPDARGAAAVARARA